MILALWKKQEDLLQVQGQVVYLLIPSQTNKNPSKQTNKYRKRMTGICPKRSRSIEMLQAERKKRDTEFWRLPSAIFLLTVPWHLPSLPKKSSSFLKIVASHFLTLHEMDVFLERLLTDVLPGTFRPETVVGRLVSGHLTSYSTSAVSGAAGLKLLPHQPRTNKQQGPSLALPDRSLGTLSSLSTAESHFQSLSCFLF